MKLIQISAPNSNSGKTVSTIVLLRGIKNKGFSVSGLKCGPDFIDGNYHAFASGSKKRNIDIHLMGRNGIKKGISVENSQFGILEGAMGYFDGMGRGYESSAFDIACELDINTVLVYEPKGEMFTIIPKLKGMIDFSKNRIKGIIFTKTNKMMFSHLKKMVEENLDIKVLGFIEKDENLKLESRNLGLLLPEEKENLDEILNNASKNSYETVDYEEFFKLFKEVDFKIDKEIKKSNLKIAIAKDEAFSFYYQENEELFKKYFEVKYFSPLEDKKLPNCDLVYIGGGYPELFKEKLSKNTEMINSLKKYVEDGGFLYSESGGLIYLSESIDGIKMCGILKGHSKINSRLQNFGYVYIKLEKDCILGKKGDLIPAHEFHYSSIDTDLEPIFSVEKASKTSSWKSGYQYKNAIFSFQHINFLGNENVLESIINYIEKNKIFTIEV